jgi:hypothetical protein
MPESISTRRLQLAFGGLLLLALAATAHTGALSRTPAAIEPALDNLSLPGFRLDSLGRSDPARERHHASSMRHRWSAEPVAPGLAPFELEAVVVHSSTSGGLEIHELVRNAGLAAAEHEVQTLEPAGQASEEVAIGASGDDMVLRTCITPGGRALLSGLKKTLHAERPTGARARTLQALGLQANIRWECLLVSISVPRSDNSQAELLASWKDAKTPLLGWKKSVLP